MNDLVRSFFNLCRWFLALAFSFAGTVVLLFVNYFALKNALELQGTEMRPVVTDELVGLVLAAFIPQATLAHMNAMIASVLIWIGWFLIAHLSFEIHQLIEDRIAYSAAGSTAQAEQAKRYIIRDVLLIIVFGMALLVAIFWDMRMYQFRSAAAAMGIEDPHIAATTIPALDVLLQKNHGLFAFRLIPLGAFAYVALTMIGCLAFEVFLGKVSIAWAQFATVVGELYTAVEQRLVGQGEELQYADESLQYADEDQLNENHQIDAAIESAPAPAGGTVTALNGTGTAAPSAFGVIFDSPRSPTRPESDSLTPVGNAAANSAPPDIADDTLIVIGSPDEHVTLAEARRDPRLIVDQDGNIWLRSHYDIVYDAAA